MPSKLRPMVSAKGSKLATYRDLAAVSSSPERNKSLSHTETTDRGWRAFKAALRCLSTCW